MGSARWYALDDTPLSNVELDAAAAMYDIEDTATMQMVALDERAQPRATVMLVHRAKESLLISVRVDGSIVIATDDESERWW